MTSSLHLTVLTPARAVYDADVASLVAPAFDGELGVLPGHAPLLSLLGSGVLHAATADGQTVRLAVRGGFLQVNQNKVTVLTPESVAVGEVNAQALKAEAEKLAEQHPTRADEREALTAKREWLKAKEKIA